VFFKTGTIRYPGYRHESEMNERGPDPLRKPGSGIPEIH